MRMSEKCRNKSNNNNSDNLLTSRCTEKGKKRIHYSTEDAGQGLPKSPEEVPRPIHIASPAAGLALGVAGNQGLGGHLHVRLTLDRDAEKAKKSTMHRDKSPDLYRYNYRSEATDAVENAQDAPHQPWSRTSVILPGHLSRESKDWGRSEGL